MNYATIGEVKDAVSDSLSPNTTKYDALLTALIARASRYIDILFKKPVGGFMATASSAKLFDGNGKRVLHIDEAVSISLVEYSFNDGSFTAFGAGTWLAMPYDNSPFWGIQTEFNNPLGYFPKGTANIRVTAVWGYSAVVPDLIKQATIIQTVRWFKRGQSNFGDAFASQLVAGLEFVKGIDPDVETMMQQGGFRRVTL